MKPSDVPDVATSEIASGGKLGSDAMKTMPGRAKVSNWIQSRTIEQRYFPIDGRRSDPSLTEAFNKKRKVFERENEHHMTCDRIAPQREMDCLCAKVDESGYRAISIPPTSELGPMWADEGKVIREKETAVRGNRYLSDVRKKFLITGWPYWESWSGGGVRHGADRESSAPGLV